MSKDENNLKENSGSKGNFTLAAVKKFKEHLVNETNYLEKVDYLKHKDTK